jgi:hypothetical protein
MREANRTKSASGFKWVYYIAHNMIGVLFFFLLVLAYDLFNVQTSDLSQILSLEYFKYFIYLFGMYIFIGILSRAFAYALLYLLYGYSNYGIPNFLELNQGINSFTTVAYFVEALLNSLFFILGLLFILQSKLSPAVGNDLAAILIAYLLIKSGVAIFIKWKYNL